MVELSQGHGRYLGLCRVTKVEYIHVVKFAKFIEGLVVVSRSLIGFSKVFCVGSEPFQYIIIIVGPYSGVEYGGGAVGGVAPGLLHDSKYFALVRHGQVHQQVVLLDVMQIRQMAYCSLQIRSSSSIGSSEGVAIQVRFPSFLPIAECLFQDILCLAYH